jgi:hypothetical protein
MRAPKLDGLALPHDFSLGKNGCDRKRGVTNAGRKPGETRFPRRVTIVTKFMMPMTPSRNTAPTSSVADDAGRLERDSKRYEDFRRTG